MARAAVRRWVVGEIAYRASDNSPLQTVQSLHLLCFRFVSSVSLGSICFPLDTLPGAQGIRALIELWITMSSRLPVQAEMAAPVSESTALHLLARHEADMQATSED